MTEEEAQAFVRAKFGGSLHDAVSLFVDMVRAENANQNLIAASTVDHIWSRHVLDSLQLLLHVDVASEDRWIDIGTGGGFPGLVTGLAHAGSTVLVEPRKLRAGFLARAVERLGAQDRIAIHPTRIENTSLSARFISARAVGSMDAVFAMASGAATLATTWLLPRGRVDLDELAELRRKWAFVFHVKQSIVSPDSAILLIDQVRRL